MTQRELIQEFKTYPPEVKSVVLEELRQIYEEDSAYSNNGKQISVEEKLALVESLAGALKMENPPMTKEAEREFIYEYLKEKYK